MDALKAHKSQFLNPAKSRDYIWALDSMARSYGSLIGVKYGQGFRIGEPLEIRDLFSLVRSSTTSRGDARDSRLEILDLHGADLSECI
jgi:hypothetical protein